MKINNLFLFVFIFSSSSLLAQNIPFPGFGRFHRIAPAAGLAPINAMIEEEIEESALQQTVNSIEIFGIVVVGMVFTEIIVVSVSQLILNEINDNSKDRLSVKYKVIEESTGKITCEGTREVSMNKKNIWKILDFGCELKPEMRYLLKVTSLNEKHKFVDKYLMNHIQVEP